MELGTWEGSLAGKEVLSVHTPAGRRGRIIRHVALQRDSPAYIRHPGKAEERRVPQREGSGTPSAPPVARQQSRARP